jgi:septum formation topological specificity factor MinE
MNKVLIVLLIVISFISWNSLEIKQSEIDELIKENFTLNDKLKSQVTITNDRVKVVYKVIDKVTQKEVVKYINKYIPPESKDLKINTDKNNKIEVIYDRYGFIFLPYVGICFDSDINPEIGMRILYYDRFGLGLSARKNGLGIGFDYRINYGIINNSAIGLYYNINDKAIGVDLHTFL